MKMIRDHAALMKMIRARPHPGRGCLDG
jgi:hypothetical protein